MSDRLITKLLVSFLLSVATFARAQTKDSTMVHSLNLLEIVYNTADSLPGLSERNQRWLLTGTKSESIQLSKTPTALPLKTGRQIFAKVPGVFVYDMDGAGNQLHIATRGLDPHRGWEFNIRKDGILTNSDLFGYPASHFSVPMESVDRIELVRGTAATQYGAQFGGVVNFITKAADTTKVFNFESTNSIGSYNLKSAYNAAHGKIGKFTYYAYYALRSRAGYREREQSKSENQSIRIDYQVSSRLKIGVEWSRSYYKYQIPGPLTDSMFLANPRAATRARNFYSPDIQIPTFRLEWKPNERFDLYLNSSFLHGTRSSVMFDRVATIPDTVNSATGRYANRQVDIDTFNSFTNELRVNYKFKIGRKKTYLSAGAQYLNNLLFRRQLGKGTTGSNYDLSLVDQNFGRDLRLKSYGLSAFVQWQISITNRTNIQFGGRLESGSSKFSGTTSYYNSLDLPVTIAHNYPLLNAGFSHSFSKHTKLYGSIGQAWRPMLLKDLIPTSIYEITDKNIKDAFGYNSELGLKGHFRDFTWDVNAFLLQYNRRFGTLVNQDSAGTFFVYRTNIGNSRSLGIEWLLEYNKQIGKSWNIQLFSCGAYMNAVYTNAAVRNGNSIQNINGNQIESAPHWNLKHAIGFGWKKLTLQLQTSFVSETFADALNTVAPDASGARGLVPSYTLFDANLLWSINKHFELRATLNNMTNTSYFTKRPQLYPGPGIWPSDGRNALLTFTFKI
jgi:Fe(3+) dicitrate transport protein